ncbi:MAG TPA: hypothetical protein VJ722_10115, partial [Rhodanobacteraceae bacterium]|nr:hypothetical protein [Rhodanobacteraceae bacterium]
YSLPGVRPVLRTLFPYSIRRGVLSRARRIADAGNRGDTREELRTLFRPDVERLAGLIGRDLSHWL